MHLHMHVQNKVPVIELDQLGLVDPSLLPL